MRNGVSEFNGYSGAPLNLDRKAGAPGFVKPRTDTSQDALLRGGRSGYEIEPALLDRGPAKADALWT